MLKKAVELIKLTALKYKTDEVVVLLEGGKDGQRLLELLNLVFDNQCPWQIIHYSPAKNKKQTSFGSYLKDNPKKVLVLTRSDKSIFIEGQKDIRPLKYYYGRK